MARWLGTFEEAYIDEKAEEFLISAGKSGRIFCLYKFSCFFFFRFFFFTNLFKVISLSFWFFYLFDFCFFYFFIFSDKMLPFIITFLLVLILQSFLLWVSEFRPLIWIFFFSVTFTFDISGYPKEVAHQIGPTISTITFAQDGNEYVQTITTPSVGRSNELRFKLGEAAEIPGKNGVMVKVNIHLQDISQKNKKIFIKTFFFFYEIKSLFNWKEATRTLHSTFQIGNGPQFTIDFVFSEDYQRAMKVKILRYDLFLCWNN